MPRKQLKEYFTLMKFCHDTWFTCRETIEADDGYKREMKLIHALIRTVRADEREKCAKVATGKNDACGKCAEYIAAAIRGKK